jgi:pimeloyl-ACP methyl ester carboxylesterase
MFHRGCRDAPDENGAIVHMHGFGISGTYLEPSAALLAARHPTFVPDLPGMGRSLRPEHPLDLPGLARALDAYCDAVGDERATFVGNSLGCPIIVELATTFPDRIDRVVLISPAGGRTTCRSDGRSARWPGTRIENRRRWCRSRPATTSASACCGAGSCSGR